LEDMEEKHKRKNRVIVKRILFGLLIAALVSVICILAYQLYYVHFRCANLISYSEKILDIELEDNIQNFEGTIYKDWHHDGEDDWFIDEYVIAKFTIKSGYEDEMLAQLDEKCWKEAQFKPPLRNHNDDSIIDELNNKKLYSSYYTVMKGEYGMMSRFVDIYVVWEDDVMCIYICG